ncbi:hypothetical protein K470DRAFT_246723 [Piedraia hortae CBS 480.64]|uniref:Uncharacterized protein n=1 Tax=Piedraia hortae CBS 480.64 TaxID=1314780 RepID=A0A6A7C0E4_9PEZI|nr:hypothetical protein K470DRAFT_246723 [Piedraia hortae CBS 480.64]
MSGRPLLLTVCCAAITVTGAWYGAGLKIREEKAKEREEYAQTSVAEKIRKLEDFKAGLVRQRSEIEEKVARINEKVMDNVGG